MMALNLLAAAIVLVRGLIALNNMCPGTALAMRVTWVLLTAGAGAVLLFSSAPAWPEVALHCGIAAIFCFDRRNPFFQGPSCS